jgi:hypothetical protein
MPAFVRCKSADNKETQAEVQTENEELVQSVEQSEQNNEARNN